MKFPKPLLIGLVILLLVLAVGGGWFFLSKKNPVPVPVVAEPTPEPKPPVAVMHIFTGHVFIVPPGATEQAEATEGQEIVEGTKIITGDDGRAQLLYPNKSVTRIDSKTEIVLKKLASNPVDIEVKLEKHRIWNRVAKLLGQEQFQSETNTVVATVRGTSFGHGILPDGRNRVLATRGTVETSCVNESQEATVSANSKILLDCTSGGVLPTLKFDEQIKDRDEWFFFNQDQDKLLDDEFGPDTYDDATKSGVLGVSIDKLLTLKPFVTPKPTIPVIATLPLIDCVGVDGKISRVTQEACDFVNNYWKAHPPPAAPAQTTSSTSTTSTSSTSSPNPTPIPTRVPYTATSVSDGGGGNIYLTINGPNLTGKETVEIFELNATGTPYTQSTTGSLDGYLYVSFIGVPCGKTYGFKVNGGTLSDTITVNCPMFVLLDAALLPVPTATPTPDPALLLTPTPTPDLSLTPTPTP